MPAPNPNYVFRGYSPDDFLAVTEAIEDQGGQHIPGPCIAPQFKLEVPTYRGRRIEKFFATGCGNDARFLIPYEGPRENAVALVCAVDDAVGLWPRFQNTTKEEE